MQTFLSIPDIRFVLRLYCVSAVVSMSLQSTYCIFVRSRPHYDFFLTCSKFCHVNQNSKVVSRPYRFLLRSFYVVQVSNALNRFYIDVVGTWSSVSGV